MLPEVGSDKFQAILHGINHLIEEDRLKPGDRLPSERELAERLGAGRSSVREVLRALELLGLITTRRGEGRFLNRHDAHYLVDILAFYILRDERSQEDLLEMRLLLEMDAARLAAERVTAEEIAQMSDILEKMKEKIRQNQLPVAEDFAFHRQIISAAKNRLLSRVWYPILHFSQCVRLNASSWPGRPLQALAEHREVLAAIASHDPERAAEAMKHHLVQSGLANTSA
ncbi:FadR/GntR family transcriptional regulator [Polycladomyces abyssicola]|jgi:GntR family transcriptional regulator, transcriptional repressor for pyruvate dehydrogenase complex|nr:FadR/GntR family transcriptional regulator [Polycladomyces abyssicola]